MNIFSKYIIQIYDTKELIKLNKCITIGKSENEFYFKNDFNINNDFGYAALLDLDIRAYRKIMYSNVEYKESINQTTYLYKNYKDAIKKKRLLLILLLERYNTYEEVIMKMKYLLANKN